MLSLCPLKSLFRVSGLLAVRGGGSVLGLVRSVFCGGRSVCRFWSCVVLVFALYRYIYSADVSYMGNGASVRVLWVYAKVRLSINERWRCFFASALPLKVAFPGFWIVLAVRDGGLVLGLVGSFSAEVGLFAAFGLALFSFLLCTVIYILSMCRIWVTKHRGGYVRVCAKVRLSINERRRWFFASALLFKVAFPVLAVRGGVWSWVLLGRFCLRRWSVCRFWFALFGLPLCPLRSLSRVSGLLAVRGGLAFRLVSPEYARWVGAFIVINSLSEIGSGIPGASSPKGFPRPKRVLLALPRLRF